MKKTTVRKKLLLAALALTSSAAMADIHKFVGLSVGDPKDLVISKKNVACQPKEGQSLPFESFGSATAIVCDLEKAISRPKEWGKARSDAYSSDGAVLVKFFKPYSVVGEIAVARVENFDSFLNVTPDKPNLVKRETRSESAYWIKGDLITALTCFRRICSLTSGRSASKLKEIQTLIAEKSEIDKAAMVKAEGQKALMDSFNKK